ncbi:uncharacterized protein LOC112126417 [Cimex lectularius]|uniref:Uncharacterized protein n=1 Tax=Cimex lectularius TaxID=79782 RepID=A0A8I6TIM1_CIMLE|nr:uncharacterized protein LOC112126417 [Cimex lectularius]
MTSAEKHVHAKDITHSAMKDSHHHHEIIICDECLVFQAKGFHFAYESILERPEMYSWGTIDQYGPISFPLSFHMTVMTSHNKTTLKKDCTTTLEDIKISNDPKISSGEMSVQELGSKSGSFSFLADDIQSWFGNHFNTTVLKHLQLKVNGFASTLIKTNNICKDFLTGGIFINVDDKYCN